MKNWKYGLLAGLAVMGGISCTGGKKTGSETEKVKTVAKVAEKEVLLELPEIPFYIEEEGAKRSYLAAHYWDRLDLDDKRILGQREDFEKALVNYVYCVSAEPMAVADSCIVGFMTRLLDDRDWLIKTIEAAEFYLFDISSPIVNEAVYVPFVKTALKSALLTEEERVKYADQLEVAQKNNPGSRATNFVYWDRKGKRRTLYGRQGKVTVLFFGDPECESCRESIAAFAGEEMVEGLIRNGQLELLLIYTEGDREVWKRMQKALPESWTLGFDRDEAVLMKRLYELRAMPSIYLLDQDCRVLLKDKPAKVVLGFLHDGLKGR